MDVIYETFLGKTDWILPAVAICLATYIYIKWLQRIPGPIGLPYLGYYPFFSDDIMHKQLTEMTKKYGDVFCFTVTGQTYAHLGSFKAMREAFVTKGNCFTTKSPNFSLIQDSVTHGVFNTSGETWKILRRFFSQKMKDYGMGKQTQEVWMADSLQRTVDALKNSKGQDFNAPEFFTENCSVAIRHLLFGSTDVGEDDIKGIVEGFGNIVLSVTGKRLLLAGPLLKYVMMPFMSVTPKYKKGKSQVNSILSKIFRQHEKNFDKNNIRNLVDCYIDERRILEEKDDPRSKIYSESAFVDTCIQIIGDAALTISAFTVSVLKAISNKPEVQKRIQAEVDEVVGRDRFPTWELKNRMPYTIAVMYETVRAENFFPFFPSLECTEATTIGGCPIPKGAILLNNFYSALNDPGTYDKPEVFDPTRFLPTEGKTKPELPNIFGMGKRSCLGESLANMETFLFVTTVVQNFDLLPPTTKEQMNPFMGDWTVRIRAVPRKS